MTPSSRGADVLPLFRCLSAGGIGAQLEDRVRRVQRIFHQRFNPTLAMNPALSEGASTQPSRAELRGQMDSCAPNASKGTAKPWDRRVFSFFCKTETGPLETTVSGVRDVRRRRPSTTPASTDRSRASWGPRFHEKRTSEHTHKEAHAYRRRQREKTKKKLFGL